MRKLWPAAPALPLSSRRSDRWTRDRPRRDATALDTRKDKATLTALHLARDSLTTTVDDDDDDRATIDDDDDDHNLDHGGIGDDQYCYLDTFKAPGSPSYS